MTFLDNTGVRLFLFSLAAVVVLGLAFALIKYSITKLKAQFKGLAQIVKDEKEKNK